MSKTSETIALFHEMKSAVVARLFEGQISSHGVTQSLPMFCSCLVLFRIIINVQDESGFRLSLLLH